jgi:peptidase M28-like protein
VESVFREFGFEVRREPVIRPDGGSSDNVIGRLPGVNYASGYLLVGAHYDTVAGSPGANDNASGVAVMLSVAEALSETAAPVGFVAFAAEERQPPTGRDLNGSRAYAERSDLNLVKAMVSVDMVGNGRSLVIGHLRDTPAEVQVELGSNAADLACRWNLPTSTSPTTPPSPAKESRRRGSGAVITQHFTPPKTSSAWSVRRIWSGPAGRY